MTQAQTLAELHQAISGLYSQIVELEATVEAVKGGKAKEPEPPPEKRGGRPKGSKNKKEDPGISPEDQAKIDALNRDLDDKG